TSTDLGASFSLPAPVAGARSVDEWGAALSAPFGPTAGRVDLAYLDDAGPPPSEETVTASSVDTLDQGGEAWSPPLVVDSRVVSQGASTAAVTSGSASAQLLAPTLVGWSDGVAAGSIVAHGTASPEAKDVDITNAPRNTSLTVTVPIVDPDADP